MDTKISESNGGTSINNFQQYEITIKQEINIPELLEKTKKAYDICMIGKITDRNKPIIETLRSQYYRVDHIPDPEDNERIAKSFIILNVHQDDTKEYNSNLLDKWLCDGIKILSEECSTKLNEKIKMIKSLNNYNSINYCYDYQIDFR